MDAAEQKDDCWCLGMIIRRSSGDIKLMVGKKVGESFEATMAEALALQWAMEMSFKHGLTRIDVESDNNNR